VGETVTAVVVAYNRQALLSDALDALAAQTHPLARIIVIDNASTDESAAVARAHPAHPEVVTLSRNTGGAGGFAAGLALALAADGPAAGPAGFVWLMDDDTIPAPTALEALLRAGSGWADAHNGHSPAVLSSRAVWTDGRTHPMNTPRRRPFARVADVRAAARVHALPIRSASFVSLLVAADAARAEGLPIADYFLWNDDFEYSARLLRTRVGLWAPDSVVEHRTAYFGATDQDPGERFRFEVRNKLWLFRASPALAGRDRLLYGASTLARWLRTFAGSSDRGLLRRAFAAGLREGIGRLPRPNAAVFADVEPGGVATAMQRLESEAQTGSAPAIRTPPLEAAEFAVLLPVYAGDRADRFRAALRSATAGQTRRPAEVVIVRDGPVGAELQRALDTAAETTDGVPVRLVPLERNTGLAGALNAGLRRCRTEIVARQDADDLSRPTRFERLIPRLADHDLVGSYVQEFTARPDGTPAPGLVRTVPLDRAAIRAGARLASPFHHPSVAFRRSVVLAAGGYPALASMEDYALWATLIARGAATANVPEPLVLYRVDAGAYARRGGWGLLRAELRMQRRLRRAGLTSPVQCARNVVVRGAYRLVPETARRSLYRVWQGLRSRRAHPTGPR
jgi:GT2 family glycosyltransferase